MEFPVKTLTAALAIVFGLVGLFMASRAQDDGIYMFGLGMFIFAVGLTFSFIRAHYQEK